MKRVSAVLIAGPTASGKSALAAALALRNGGVVINADSMQVYADLAVLTARPTPEETARVPHALYGHVKGSHAYSVARWLEDVEAVLADCEGSGRLPVICGGTGLYFKALLEGMSPIPHIPPDIRTRWREAARNTGPEALHRLLAGRDPETAARLRPSDTQRLTRALEVWEATGRGICDWQKEAGRPVLDPERVERLVIRCPREVIRGRAEARLDVMVAGGALDEVKRLAAKCYAADLPVMRALGVRPLLAHLAGELQLAAAVAQAKSETGRYIKRQETWCRSNMIAWNAVNLEDMETFGGLRFTFIGR